MHRVLIGQDANGNPGDYVGNSTGVQAALAAGHRWLVFQEANIQVTSTIDLDGLSNRFLRLEGGGVRGTIFDRQGMTADAPIIQAQDEEWVMQWNGVTFTGLVAEDGDPASCPDVETPLVVIDKIRDSRFEQCAWVANPGIGLDIGAGWARNVLFQSCEILQNCLEGVRIRNADTIDFMKCVIERNGRRDRANHASVMISGAPAAQFRGTVVVRDCHSEADVVQHVAIQLESYARGCDIVRNYIALAGIELGTNTQYCKVARNRLFTAGLANAGEIDDNGSGNTIVSTGREANRLINTGVSP